MINEESVGKFFINENGEYYELISYCAQPTATFRKVGTVDTDIGGGVYSPNVKQFKPLDDLTQKTIKAVMDQYHVIRYGRSQGTPK